MTECTSWNGSNGNLSPEGEERKDKFYILISVNRTTPGDQLTPAMPVAINMCSLNVWKRMAGMLAKAFSVTSRT